MLWPLVDMNSGQLVVTATVDENDIDPAYVPPEPDDSTLGGARVLSVRVQSRAEAKEGRVTVRVGNTAVLANEVIGPDVDTTRPVARNPRRNIADLTYTVSYRAV